MSADDEYTLLQLGVMGLVVVAAAVATLIQVHQWWHALACTYAYSQIIWSLYPVLVRRALALTPG